MLEREDSFAACPDSTLPGPGLDRGYVLEPQCSRH